MAISDQLIKLNIGGTLFQTTKSTLTKFDGFFNNILKTRLPFTKSESGAIFIDRSPKHFRLILNYMKDGDVILPNSQNEIQEILKEARAYELKGLVEMCEKNLEMRNSSAIVKLNIGGTLFQTSRSTLTKFDGFFKTILETEILVTKDESGAIFVDRDPKHFRLVLNFMRDGDVDIPNSDEDRRELLKEAQYYQLTGLVELCNKKLIEAKNQLPMYPDIIKLNLRGTIFETRKATLTKIASTFKVIIDNNVPLKKDASGAIFIDRPPKHFHLILNYMQDNIIALPESSQEIIEICREALAYKMENLRKLCEKTLGKEFPSTSEYLSN